MSPNVHACVAYVHARALHSLRSCVECYTTHQGLIFFWGGGAALHLESDAQCASLSESDAHCVRTETNKKLVVFIVAYNK